MKNLAMTALVLSLAACAPPEPEPLTLESAAEVNARYLEGVRGEAPITSLLEDHELVEVGLSACSLMDLGHSESDVVTIFIESGGSREVGVAITHNARENYCPD